MNAAGLITPTLLLVAFGISFFFHGTHDIAYAPAIFLVLVAGLVCILPALKNRIHFPIGACVWLTLAFWGYLSVSLLWTSVPFASLVTWLNFTVLPIILLGLLCAGNRDTLIRHSLLALIGGTIITALYVLWQFFAEGMQRAPGLLLNPNNMAAILNLSLLPLLAYGVTGDKKYRVAVIIGALILFAALIATGSRGGLLCFLSGIALIALALYKPVKTDWRSAATIVASFAVLFAGFYFLTNTSLPQSLAVLGNPAADYSSFERLSIWKGGWALLQDHLLTGTGLGTFYLYYPAYRLDGDMVSLGHWAHFDALQLGAETGIAAIILFYAVALAWLVRGAKALLKIPATDPRRVMIAGCMAALLALTLHAHIEFQFYIMANLIMAGVLMAALYSLTQEQDHQSFMAIALEKHDRYVWSGALLLTALMVSLTLLSTAAGVYFLNRANAAYAKADLGGFTDNIALSRQYSPRSFADADVQLAGLYVDLVAHPSGMMTAADKITAYHDGLQLLSDAQAANPAWADIDHKRAKFYARIDEATEPGHEALARASWREALRKNPLHYHAREEYARYLIKQGRVDDAYAVLQDSLHRPMTNTARAVFRDLNNQIKPLIDATRQHQQEIPLQK